tara:strand:+ start:133 stop:423 length:291 start_codon:yes stop_codon:yes gene_type:complete
MAKQKDGITDLTKVLVSAAKKFTDAEYTKLQQVIFALLHGVNYGYDSMDQRFINDAQDILFIHRAQKNLKKIKKKTKKKDNVVYINFTQEGIKDDA